MESSIDFEVEIAQHSKGVNVTIKTFGPAGDEAKDHQKADLCIERAFYAFDKARQKAAVYNET